jgi:hypothetical protein
MTEDNQLTIFEVKNDQFQKALDSFISGNTPHDVIKKRPMRGGGDANYVNTYWMTEQIGLLTGFRWSSECLEEKAIPNWDKPREIGAKMKVTIWDRIGKTYNHTSWGQKEVAYYKSTYADKSKAGLPMSIFDDLKAAYSDGIKKCLSYFGIARDIYGGKELEFFQDDSTSTGDNITDSGADEFDRYISSIGMTYDQVFDILKITSFSEIKNYKLAYDTIKAFKEGKTIKL